MPWPAAPRRNDPRERRTDIPSQRSNACFLAGDANMNRSERRHRTCKAVRAQVRIARRVRPQGAVVEKPGMLKKRRALDCGRPRCALCGNPRRFAGKVAPTLQERRQQHACRAGLMALLSDRDDSAG
jgi:hypothetical protein